MKPFQKVLVRDEDGEIWRASLFSNYSRRVEGRRFECVGFACTFRQCIPYDGNEHLCGTTDNPTPKPDIKQKLLRFGDKVELTIKENDKEKKYLGVIYAISYVGEAPYCVSYKETSRRFVFVWVNENDIVRKEWDAYDLL